MKAADLTPAELRQLRAGRANLSAGGGNPRGPQPLSSVVGSPAEPSGRGASPGQEKGASPNRNDADLATRPAPRPANPIWGCHTCPATFTALAAAERHADSEHHHRYDWLPAKGVS